MTGGVRILALMCSMASRSKTNCEGTVMPKNSTSSKPAVSSTAV